MANCWSERRLVFAQLLNFGSKDDESGLYSGFITLERDDVGKLIEILQDAKRTMDAETKSLEPKPISVSSDSLN